jgi:murein DD-endopeptidase MepM/ murein hydrolase activator NlpD
VQTLSFDGQFQMPLSFTKSDISSGVGVRSGVAGYATHMHEGIDIPKSVGTTIQSSTDGIVIAKEMNDTFGYHIVVYAGEQNGTSYFLLYAHCSTISVSVGDKVTAGQNIAAVGQTGRVTGPHLHFGIYSASASGDSKTLNPELIFF